MEQAAPKQSPAELREEFITRLQLLDETINGRSDETSRQLVAGYIRRIEYSPSQNQGILILQPGLTLPTAPDDDSGGSSADSGGAAEDSAIESVSDTDVSGEAGLAPPTTTSRQLDLFPVEDDVLPENGTGSKKTAKFDSDVRNEAQPVCKAKNSTIVAIKNAVPEPSGTACRSGAGDPVLRLHVIRNTAFVAFRKTTRILITSKNR